MFDILDSGFDILIAHPPCTYLAVSGNRWRDVPGRKEKADAALVFVRRLMNANIPHVCIENPVSIISSQIRRPEQIIQPWQFGESYQKTTCLWLKNLPLLVPTEIVDRGKMVRHGKNMIPEWYSNRTRKRDKTFAGIANAMASQWGNLEGAQN